ncbi:hypothetical protein H4Q26_007438 [Puccinia striiformis f. sp. tritici PST-130]|nr:hypothetical protein H4Q26_007438 [Puccinia striiformis f. sp. tritici PST-130]
MRDGCARGDDILEPLDRSDSSNQTPTISTNHTTLPDRIYRNGSSSPKTKINASRTRTTPPIRRKIKTVKWVRGSSFFTLFFHCWPSEQSPPVQSPVATGHSGKDEAEGAGSLRPQTVRDARSAEVTQLRAGGKFVAGTVNQHPPVGSTAGQAFKVGVSEDRNRKCRRTMEDSHSFLYSFGDVDGQGYFAVFDGHAGKHAAEWCGQWFHEYLLTN